MKQQLFLSYGWGENQGEKTRLAECLSFCQVLLRPVHNKEMDWQVEKEDREASMIYCLQPRRSFQLLWQSIYQRNQNILRHLQRDVLQIQITSVVFLWLNKSIKSSYVPKKVCRARTHTHTQKLLPPKVWNLSNPPLQLPFNTSKMHYPYAVKWTLCYSFKARRLSSILFSALYIYIYPATQLCDPLASVLPYRLWQILSGCWEADLQSEARAIFTLAQVWLEVFLQHCNA